MISDFEPLFRSPHLATIAANFWPRQIDTHRFPGSRVQYSIDAKTNVLAIEHQPQQKDCVGQIVFLHGLEGSAASGYILSLAQEALLLGFGVHRLNMRTCGGTERLSPTMYHSGLTADPLFVLNQLQKRRLGPLFLVGFSLGGNVALKLCGELGNSSLLAGACAISTPIDLAASVRAIDHGFNRLYARRFLGRLKARIRSKNCDAPGVYPTVGLDEITSIWAFDDRFTAPSFGFGTAANYYATQSAQNFLSAIRVPTLVIAAKDDPMVPFEMYGNSAFESNPALTLLAPDQGGHVGFLSRRKPRFWLDQTILKWLGNVESGASKEALQSARFE